MNEVVITIQGENKKNLETIAQKITDMLTALEDKGDAVMEDVGWGATMDGEGLL